MPKISLNSKNNIHATYRQEKSNLIKNTSLLPKTKKVFKQLQNFQNTQFDTYHTDTFKNTEKLVSNQKVPTLITINKSKQLTKNKCSNHLFIKNRTVHSQLKNHGSVTLKKKNKPKTCVFDDNLVKLKKKISFQKVQQIKPLQKRGHRKSKSQMVQPFKPNVLISRYSTLINENLLTQNDGQIQNSWLINVQQGDQQEGVLQDCSIYLRQQQDIDEEVRAAIKIQRFWKLYRTKKLLKHYEFIFRSQNNKNRQNKQKRILKFVDKQKEFKKLTKQNVKQYVLPQQYQQEKIIYFNNQNSQQISQRSIIYNLQQCQIMNELQIPTFILNKKANEQQNTNLRSFIENSNINYFEGYGQSVEKVVLLQKLQQDIQITDADQQDQQQEQQRLRQLNNLRNQLYKFKQQCYIYDHIIQSSPTLTPLWPQNLIINQYMINNKRNNNILNTIKLVYGDYYKENQQQQIKCQQQQKIQSLNNIYIQKQIKKQISQKIMTYLLEQLITDLMIVNVLNIIY